MGVDRPRVAEVIVIPHIIKNLLSRKGNSLILHKICQKFEFFISLVSIVSIDRNLMGGFIDTDSSDLDQIRGDGVASS